MTAETATQDRLHVLWTSNDPEVAMRMVFMYTLNSRLRGWWDAVNLIVWGPSAKLLATHPKLQEEIGRMLEAGVTMEACKACADSYGVSEDLEKLGVTVRFMGEPLTRMLKAGERIITF